jgi:hypothetical protein
MEELDWNHREGAMKKAAIGIVGLAILAVILTAQNVHGFSVRNYTFFTGEITDSICAEGHHIDVVIAKKNCVLACVKVDGAQFVLSNSKTKRNYKLDDQKLPEPFAGQEVIVSGILDRDTNSIHAINIRPMVTYTSLFDSLSFHGTKLLY